ncbi:SDR family NAD(P)-dependent oxidoreductase [Halopiger aswanensis]|uniref:NAD(P)-dependent dehydrogenase (Short-subunit alcohol dehydrogenase family) n=1 Tax=Halopiger aswanensis TaxID=148449 RepID=A0A3R7D7Z6_9EURY|nr:SDR family oxidoreductase [Halopiger aswanensis]RKD89246.1 NAD(P)-dependent dehydrogenase (short-subunit alcohol dehydrogenase family) [Halopiger aswanensis]
MGTSEYDFTGETVIVTGGSSGIGRSVAKRFGHAGATVLVADVRESPKGDDDRAPTHERIERDGGEARFVQTDVSDPADLEALVEAAREFGGVDVMVNNAGIFRGGSLLDLDVETFDTVYETNARSVFAGCQAAAADMADRGVSGSIINTASISSEYAQVGHAAYDPSKAAIMMLTRVAALECTEYDIRVNAVAPGPVATQISTENDGSTTDRSGFQKPNPMGRRAPPDEIAGSYLYLASDDASFVTGHMLYVDGGHAIY